MSRASAFSLYVREWFVDTADLDVAEEGAYIRLLAYSWVKPLPCEPAKLARIVRVNTRRWNAIWRSLSCFFECGPDGVMRNKRLEEERRKCDHLKQIQSTKGKASVRARRNRGSTAAEPNHQPEPAPPTVDDEFAGCWSVYPKRAGSNSQADALRAFKARRRDGVTVEEMLAGVQRYTTFLEATGKAGTEFVMQGARFFGASKHYSEQWDLPTAPRTRQERSDEVLRDFFQEEGGP